MDGFIQTVKYQVGFPDGSVVKNPPTNAGDTSPSLGEEDPLEEEMETHASILAWEIPWTEESGRLHSMGSQKSWTRLSMQSTKCQASDALIKLCLRLCSGGIPDASMTMT